MSAPSSVFSTNLSGNATASIEARLLGAEVNCLNVVGEKAPVDSGKTRAFSADMLRNAGGMDGGGEFEQGYFSRTYENYRHRHPRTQE